MTLQGNHWVSHSLMKLIDNQEIYKLKATREGNKPYITATNAVNTAEMSTIKW